LFACRHALCGYLSRSTTVVANDINSPDRCKSKQQRN
jgi:hypothetical protein